VELKLYENVSTIQINLNNEISEVLDDKSIVKITKKISELVRHNLDILDTYITDETSIKTKALISILEDCIQITYEQFKEKATLKDICENLKLEKEKYIKNQQLLELIDFVIIILHRFIIREINNKKVIGVGLISKIKKDKEQE
jgi:hypothetical protein